jgi:lipid II:glycine glycyltransferase (peptidoglycan interpeptide bridge formation enzyme)
MERINKIDFLQSQEWRKFQENAGRKTFSVSVGDRNINIIKHKLPIIGKYFYVPRFQGTKNKEQETKIFENIVDLAERNNAGWVRVDIDSKNDLRLITELINELDLKIKKAPHDMQPRQTFVIDISKSEEQLLAEMKSKTRYNIKLAEKKEVKISNIQSASQRTIPNTFYIDEFLRLVKITSKRQGIVSHPDDYYRKMLEIPCVQLYVAEYDGKVAAVAVVSFFEEVATYLHGASDDKYKSAMAPFALHWKIIKDAKESGCKRYDMGGISTNYEQRETTNKWKGITRFKLGFSPETKPTEFEGSWDIIISPVKYFSYKIIQKIKSFVR